MIGTHSLKELLDMGGKLKPNGNVITKFGNKGVSYWNKVSNDLYYNFNNVTIYY
jgi:hypothetical protein